MNIEDILAIGSKHVGGDEAVELASLHSFMRDDPYETEAPTCRPPCPTMPSARSEDLPTLAPRAIVVTAV